MSFIDRDEEKQHAREARADHTAFTTQWISWLGIGSAGGAVALLSLAANLPDPDYALRELLPALTSFAFGVMLAALSLLLAASKAEERRRYHTRALNQDVLLRAITKQTALPADGLVSPQEVVAAYDKQTSFAETAWKRSERFSGALYVCVILSGMAFSAGIMLPLYHIWSGEKLVPEHALPKVRR